MFTGIISNLGKVQNIKNGILKISTDKKLVGKLKVGDSVAVNGVCLTVSKKINNNLEFVVMPETEDRTNFNILKVGGLVNLETAATLNTFLSGHVVQGHVDGVGEILEIKKEGNSRVLKIKISSELNKYIVKKGSITVNGISLTVVGCDKKSFSVSIIPHTWDNTIFHQVKVVDKVNIEVDILAKYLEKFLNK